MILKNLLKGSSKIYIMHRYLAIGEKYVCMCFMHKYNVSTKKMQINDKISHFLFLEMFLKYLTSCL